jgi:hypothetical protein
LESVAPFTIAARNGVDLEMYFDLFQGLKNAGLGVPWVGNDLGQKPSFLLFNFFVRPFNFIKEVGHTVA